MKKIIHKVLLTLFMSGLLVPTLFLSASAEAALREYWLAAEVVAWDYAPAGKNQLKPGQDMGDWGHDLVYRKVRYIQYNDNSFTTPVPEPDWQGIVGPQLRAVEGDKLMVHFLNRSDKPLSIHPHGVRYNKANEGADGQGEGAAVAPGQIFTYQWDVNESAAPGPGDLSSKVWVYHSHVDAVTEIYDGLIGTIVVTKKGMERSASDPRPRDVDVALTALFMVFDENGRTKIGGPDGLASKSRRKWSAEEEQEANLKHTINGLIFGNLKGLKVKQGQRVRWHLMAMGTEVDLHTVHWHGQTVLDQGRRNDIVELLPATMKSVDMLADNPGDWLFHCHVTDHITAGMATHWQVLAR